MLTKNYEDVKLLIYSTIHLFQRQKGGIFEDLLSEANLAYTKCVHNWDPEKGRSFSSWVRQSVWYALLEYVERQAHYDGGDKLKRVSMDASYIEEQKFSLDNFLLELSPDSQKVIKLALTSRKKRFDSTKNFIVSYLKDLGWSINKILESFREIQEAL